MDNKAIIEKILTNVTNNDSAISEIIDEFILAYVPYLWYQVEYDIMMTFNGDYLLSVLLSLIINNNEREFVGSKIGNKSKQDIVDILTTHIYMRSTDDYSPSLEISRFRFEIENRQTEEADYHRKILIKNIDSIDTDKLLILDQMLEDYIKPSAKLN